MVMATAALSNNMPHAVLIPYPTTGHLNPALELARLLQSKGFYITFVNTELSHRQLLRTDGPDALRGTDTFRFETIPDGLPQCGGPGNVMEAFYLLLKNVPTPLRELILRLHASPGVPRITCIVTNFLFTFTQDVAREIGVPELVFWTTSACGLMISAQVRELIRRGFVPLKDESCLTNGHLDIKIDAIPGLKDMRLRDFSSFIRTTNPDDLDIKFEMEQVDYAMNAWGLIINTFDDMEYEVLDALRSYFPRMYTLGPMGTLLKHIAGNPTQSTRLGFWQEDVGCLQWLDSQKEASVLYVSFGSLTVLTANQLADFAWGLASSNHPFLWVIRPDMVDGGAASLPEQFVQETRGRSFFASWCDQRQVLAHRSVAGFLTHGGWNSMLESIVAGVPMICWAGFADQYVNCRYACKHWGISLEMEEVRRERVRERVVELMDGESGRELRENAKKWREAALGATRQSGSSYLGLDRLVKELNFKDDNSVKHISDSDMYTFSRYAEYMYTYI